MVDQHFFSFYNVLDVWVKNLEDAGQFDYANFAKALTRSHMCTTGLSVSSVHMALVSSLFCRLDFFYLIEVKE